MKKSISCFLVLWILAFAMPVAAKPTVSAQGAILIEARTNTILYEQNAYTKFYPASITKLMTALLVDEHLPDRSLITKSQNSQDIVPWDSSNIGLEVGDKYDKTNGLYGMLLGSDNYIAHDLALSTSGSIASFAALMNKKARSLGALNTHFVNPHGYHDPDHYTTPYDMALIAKAAFSDPTVQKIAGTAKYNFYIQNKKQYLAIQNSSRLLKSETAYYNPHVIACKTGFHDAAGQTLVAKARYGNMELIAVVMKDKRPNQYVDVNNLFKYADTFFSVEQRNDTYCFINKTIPAWAKKSIDKAVKAKLLSAGANFKDPLRIQDIYMLLKKAGASHSSISMEQLTALTGLKKGDIVSNTQLAQIIKYAAGKWNIRYTAPLKTPDNKAATLSEAVSLLDRMLNKK